MTNADLHIHSNYSDGTDSLNELVLNVQKAGLDVFSLTDHDEICGCRDILKILPKDVKFINGTELTSKIGDIKCHILGYNYNIDDISLNNLIQKGKNLRKIKLEKRIKHLKDVWNIELTEAELNWLYSRKSPVKVHFGNILVKRGLADGIIPAMDKYMEGCKTGNTRFDGVEAINTIKSAGGIAVWAHPLGGEGEVHLREDEFLIRLEFMKKQGIQGLECNYSRYSNEESAFLADCAEKNGLLISAGSDYHGKNKNNIALGGFRDKNLTILERIL